MKLKFVLIAALYSTLILQFGEAPHYIDETYEDEKGNTVRFISGDFPACAVTGTGEGEKRKWIVTVTVPKGPNLREAVTVKLPGNKVRDDIANLLNAAGNSITTGAGGEVKVLRDLTGEAPVA